MRTITILANWKSHKTIDEVQVWIARLNEEKNHIPAFVSIYLCPSFHHISEVSKSVPWTTLGVQNISPFAEGGYTGEIAATQVADIVEFVLIGHSERRKYFNETDEHIIQKVRLCLESGIKPIVCVDTEDQVLQIQKNFVDFFKIGMFLYEPPSAISKNGIGNPQDINEAKKMVQKLSAISNHTPFLYGGSIKSMNAAAFFQEEIFAGVIVGAASLDIEEFIRIISAAAHITS